MTDKNAKTRTSKSLNNVVYVKDGVNVSRTLVEQIPAFDLAGLYLDERRYL